jgi:hypothetical protein
MKRGVERIPCVTIARAGAHQGRLEVIAALGIPRWDGFRLPLSGDGALESRIKILHIDVQAEAAVVPCLRGMDPTAGERHGFRASPTGDALEGRLRS